MGATRLLVSGADDLLRCRFATSPLWETVNAARAFVDPRVRTYLRPWWEAVRDRPPAPELLALQTLGGYSPDFICLPPARPAPRIEDQLAQVRAADPGRVAGELARSWEAQADPAARALITRMLADPARSRDRLAGQLNDAWRRLVLPWWPRVRELIEADIAYRTRLLAEHGLGHVMAGLHERVRWTGGAIVVRSRMSYVRELGGAGLVLMPSAFVWPGVAAVVDEPWQPTLMYPARGIGELLSGHAGAATPPAALARLLGRTRARLLADLGEPASTSALAARYGLSASTVSAHLAALREAGLVGKRRSGHEMRYRRTALGDALAAGDPDPPGTA